LAAIKSTVAKMERREKTRRDGTGTGKNYQNKRGKKDGRNVEEVKETGANRN